MGRCAGGDGSQVGATEPGQNNDGCEADIDVFAQEWTKQSAGCRELQRVKNELVSGVEKKNQSDNLPLV